MAKKKAYQPINIRNKRASYEYNLLDKFTCGMVLTGTEIKSIRLGKASITEAYCTIINNELWVRNMHIGEYEQGSYNNHTPKRDRKLLLNRQEINKIEKQLRNKGLTCIPLQLFISDSGYAKLKIAIGQGKKLHDKRASLKDKDTQRDIDRASHGR